MDPNANLKEQREIAHELLHRALTPNEAKRKAERLAELVEALDGWIAGGGFLPADWAKGRTS